MRKISRRDFVIASGLAASISGCIQRTSSNQDNSNKSQKTDKGKDNQDRKEESNEDSVGSETSDLSYRSWLIPPSKLKEFDLSTYSFIQFKLSDIIENQEKFSEEMTQKISSWDSTFTERFPFELSEVQQVISGPVGVYEVQHEISKVVDKQKELGYRKTSLENYKGYEIYSFEESSNSELDASDPKSFAMALNGDFLIFPRSRNSNQGSSVKNIKKGIDTKNGDIKRFHETDDGFDTITSELSGGVVTKGYYLWDTEDEKDGTPMPQVGYKNTVGGGLTWGFGGDGEVADFRIAYLFEDTESLKESEMREEADQLIEKKGYQNLDVKRKGRIAVITGNYKYSEIDNIYSLNGSYSISNPNPDTETGGDEETQQVSSGVEVFSMIGEVTESSTVDIIRLRVGFRPGSQNINLGKTKMEYVDPDYSKQLKYGGKEKKKANSKHFAVTKIQDDNDSLSGEPVLDSKEDRVKILIDASEIRGDKGLKPGEKAVITISPPMGPQTVRQPIVPENIKGKDLVDLS